MINGLAAGDGEALGTVAGRAGSQFEGGLQLTGFGKAQSMFLAEFLEVEPGEGNDPSVFAKELSSDFDRAGSLGSGAKEDGEEFLIGQSTGTERGHFFPWLLIIGKIVDALVLGHRDE